jgi:MYXO-CTERM domain-containing protein
MNTMKLMLAIGAVSALCGSAQAAIYYSAGFASGYTSGNLVGQNGWAQTGTSATTPIQVTGGAAVLGTSGQDAYAAFSSAAPNTAGTTLFFAATLRMTAAQATGDYFMHVSDPAGTSTNFYGRVFAKSSGTGFVLGISPNSTTATYGSTVLDFNSNYQVVVAWDFVAGASNDTFSVYVNPLSTDRSSLTSYASAAFSGTAVEPSAQVSAINLRQGTAANAPSAQISSLSAGDSLGAVGVIPTPGALALLGLAGIVSRRRR